MKSEHIELVRRTKLIVNTINELGVHGGAYNPNKYKHYLTFDDKKRLCVAQYSRIVL